MRSQWKKWTAPFRNQLRSSNYVSDEWTIHTSWVNAHQMNGVISGSISRGSTYQTFVFIVKFKCYNNRFTKGAVDVLPLHSWGLLVSGPSYSCLFIDPWSDHPPCLSISKCNYFSNATHGSDVRWLQRLKVSIHVVHGVKMAPIFREVAAYCSSTYSRDDHQNLKFL